MSETTSLIPAPASVSSADPTPLVTSTPTDLADEPQHANETTAAKEEIVTTPVAPAAASQTMPLTPVPESATKEDEGPEPQSTLTKKFTEAEWKALKEFRVCFMHSTCSTPKIQSSLGYPS